MKILKKRKQRKQQIEKMKKGVRDHIRITFEKCKDLLNDLTNETS
jgi:hypothetical protein